MKRHRALPWLLIGGLIAVGLALNWPVSQKVLSEQDAQRESPFGSHGMQRRPSLFTWRAATQHEREAATASIVAQLKACKKGDFKRAMFYQSAILRHRFGSPSAFRRMIEGYQQFAHYKSVRFHKSRAEVKGQIVQIEVEITGMDNVQAKAIYLMVLENKIYHVGGVDGGLPVRKKKEERSAETRRA